MESRNDNLSRVVVAAVVFILLGVGIFSMSAMKHAGRSCPTAIAHHADSSCWPNGKEKSCVAFHFSLLEKFSQGFCESFGFNFTYFASVLLAFAGTFLILLNLTRNLALKVKLKRVLERHTGILTETLTRWLAIFEKRDPLTAFTFA